MLSKTRVNVYAFRYAEGTVESFVDKYPRATNFVAKICNFESKSFKYLLIDMFMKRNNQWNCVRDMIKWCDLPSRQSYITSLSNENRLKYLTNIKYIVQDYRIFEEKDYAAIDNTQ